MTNIYNENSLDDTLTKDFSHFSQVISNTCCCLIVNYANRLYSVCSICCKFGCQNVKVGTLAPITFYDINVELKALLLINPEQTKLTNVLVSALSHAPVPETKTATLFNTLIFVQKQCHKNM